MAFRKTYNLIVLHNLIKQLFFQWDPGEIAQRAKKNYCSFPSLTPLGPLVWLFGLLWKTRRHLVQWYLNMAKNTLSEQKSKRSAYRHLPSHFLTHLAHKSIGRDLPHSNYCPLQEEEGEIVRWGYDLVSKVQKPFVSVRSVMWQWGVIRSRKQDHRHSGEWRRKSGINVGTNGTPELWNGEKATPNFCNTFWGEQGPSSKRWSKQPVRSCLSI